MNLREISLALAGALAALAAGCDNKPALKAMPEVNDENCKLEYVQKIEDKGMQQDFAGKCSRRGTFKPSEPKKW